MSNNSDSVVNTKAVDANVNNHEESTSKDSGEVVLNNNSLNRNDVFLGRGGNLWRKEGNATLREICFSLMPQYENCPKIDKPQLALSIVHKIKAMDPPGRFLKKKNLSEPISLNSSTLEQFWLEVSDDVASEKVSQVFRDIRRLPKSSSSDSTPRKRIYESADKQQEKRTKMNTTMSSFPIAAPKNLSTVQNDAVKDCDAQEGFYAAPRGYPRGYPRDWWSHKNGCPPQGKSLEPLPALLNHNSNNQNLSYSTGFIDKNHTPYHQARTPKTDVSMVHEDYMMSSFYRQPPPPYCYSFPEALPCPYSMAEFENNYYYDYQNENHFNPINKFHANGQKKSPLMPQDSTNLTYQNSYHNTKYENDWTFSHRQSLSGSKGFHW